MIYRRYVPRSPDMVDTLYWPTIHQFLADSPPILGRHTSCDIRPIVFLLLITCNENEILITKSIFQRLPHSLQDNMDASSIQTLTSAGLQYHKAKRQASHLWCRLLDWPSAEHWSQNSILSDDDDDKGKMSQRELTSRSSGATKSGSLLHEQTSEHSLCTGQVESDWAAQGQGIPRWYASKRSGWWIILGTFPSNKWRQAGLCTGTYLIQNDIICFSYAVWRLPWSWHWNWYQILDRRQSV